MVGHLFNYSASQPVTRYQPSDVSNWSENFFAAIGCLFASKYNFHGNPKLYFFIDVYSRAARAPFSPSICWRALFLTLNHIYLTLTQKNLCYSAKKEKLGSGFLGSYGWLGVNPVAGRVREGLKVENIFFGSGWNVFIDWRCWINDDLCDKAPRPPPYTCDFLTAHPIRLTSKPVWKTDAALFVNIKVLFSRRVRIFNYHIRWFGVNARLIGSNQVLNEKWSPVPANDAAFIYALEILSQSHSASNRRLRNAIISKGCGLHSTRVLIASLALSRS